MTHTAEPLLTDRSDLGRVSTRTSRRKASAAEDTRATDAQAIRAARTRKRGWTQTQLAAALTEHGYHRQVGKAAIANWERGDRAIPVKARPHVEAVLGISLGRRAS